MWPRARSAVRRPNPRITMMQRAELVQVFARTATEVAEKEFANVLETTSISELGIDSLGMLEIIGSLERELKIHIPDESLAGIQTVKDLLNAVESRQST
jgi:acyl carrier protein